MTESKPFTHTAWMFATATIRRGRPIGRWYQEGDARVEPNGDVNIYLHSTPIGGNYKHIYLVKIGNKMPSDKDELPRDEAGSDDEASADGSEE